MTRYAPQFGPDFASSACQNAILTTSPAMRMPMS